MSYRKIDVSKIGAPAEITPGSAPQLNWLEISSLVIDEAYQRDLKTDNWKAIRKIAANFRWSMFSPVFVAPIEGGAYAIIDGQHRAHAAAICGFKQVPCQIVQMSRNEQAAAFAAVNGTVTKVTAGQVLKAAVMAGEPWALRMVGIAEAGGCKVMFYNATPTNKKPTRIFALAGFRKLIECHGDTVSEALRILTKTDGWNEDASYWDGIFLLPVLSALCQRRAALSAQGFSYRLAEWPIWDALDEARIAQRERAREGLSPLTARELMEISLIGWIDENFPARMAIAPPEKLSRSEAMARIGALDSKAVTK